jgi:hypothetical protein
MLEASAPVQLQMSPMFTALPVADEPLGVLLLQDANAKASTTAPIRTGTRVSADEDRCTYTGTASLCCGSGRPPPTAPPHRGSG